MATSKCPMCEGKCIIKLIAMEDERWCEVDVCRMCGTMYPRDKVVGRPPAKKKAKKGAPKGKGGRKARKK